MLPTTLTRAGPLTGSVLTLAVVSGLLASTMIAALALMHL